MGEIPHMPTRDEIYEKAIELFQVEAAIKGLPPITPEEEELKEGNYWEAARNELMTGVKDQLEQYLSYLKEEARKIEDALGIAPPLEIEELRERLEDVSDKYKRSREELRKTKRELEELKKPPPPLVALPPPPPPPAIPVVPPPTAPVRVVEVEAPPPPIREPVTEGEMVVSRECYPIFRELWNAIKKGTAMEASTIIVSRRTGIGAGLISEALSYARTRNIDKIEKLTNRLLECQCEEK